MRIMPTQPTATIDLRRPTVADVVAALMKMPQNAKIVVHDADTDSLMDRIHIGPDSEHRWSPGDAATISIWIDYQDQND